MFTSVRAGVHSLPADLDGFLLLPVDICAVRPETVDKLIAAFVLDNCQSVVYPTYGGRRGHPSLIPYVLAAGLRAYDGENGMQGYLAPFPAVEVETDDEGVLLDMDTPADYAALLRFMGLPTYPDEEACRGLLNKYQTPGQVIEHSRQVRELALRMCTLLRERGIVIDEGLLSSACLLHDIVRETPQHAARRVGASPQGGLPRGGDAGGVPYGPAGGLRTAARRAGAPVSGRQALPRRPDRPTPHHAGGTARPFCRRPGGALARPERKMEHAQAILELLDTRFGIAFGDIAGAN